MTTPAASVVHAGLAGGRWQQLTLVEQFANIGSEVARATRARDAGKDDRFANSFARCLELFDLTLVDERWRGRRREIARAREVVCDFLVGHNAHGSSAATLDAHFLAFASAVRRHVHANSDHTPGGQAVALLRANGNPLSFTTDEIMAATRGDT